MTRATLFDGTVAEAHEVMVATTGDQLILIDAAGTETPLDPELLERVDGGAAPRFARSDLPGWRLQLREVPHAELVALLPTKRAGYGRWIDRIGLMPAACLFAAVAAGVLLIGHLAPIWVAPLVPPGWERNLGQAMVGDFGDNRCTNRAGNRALALLAERVEPGIASRRGDGAIRFTALNPPIFNAAALPGGQIVVFREMFKETEPDALAGVLAHEIAHVRRRHVTQALVRELGIGALIRLFAGGIGANAEQLVALSYTRANEAEADRDSIAMLAAANIDPRPTARLFEKLSKETGEGREGDFQAEFLQSHPVSRDRARRFAASFVPGKAYRPALTPDQADSLIDVCWVKPKPKPKTSTQAT